jgi:hypothetical protein
VVGCSSAAAVKSANLVGAVAHATPQALGQPPDPDPDPTETDRFAASSPSRRPPKI